MAYEYQDFELYQGEDADIDFTIDTSIASTTVSWSLSRSPFSTTKDLELTSTDGEINIGGTDNKVATVLIASADIASLWGTYYHELAILDGAGKRTVLASGTVRINHSSTNVIPS